MKSGTGMSTVFNRPCEPQWTKCRGSIALERVEQLEQLEQLEHQGGVRQST